VPPVLLSGDHADISRWRLRQALLRTLQRRPQLLRGAQLPDAVQRVLEEFQAAGAAGSDDRGERP